MFRLLKTAARRLFANNHFPVIRDWYFDRDAARELAAIGARSRMTYAEIEAEIGSHYQKIFGRELNWNNPQTYNEKIHVSKLYMPTPLKTRLADKYLVRDWIREKLGEEYLIPLLGVYDSFDEINFDSLPDKFVIKCNHDSGSITLVSDKSKIDVKNLKRKYDFLMRRNFALMGWEMHYRDIKPKILIEQYMGEAINDYKFTCLDGQILFCWIDIDRYGTKHKRNIYNMDWEIQAFNKGGLPNSDYECPVPEEFGEMKRIVRILSEGFDQVRVDLYSIAGKIYFGEMTFTGANGFSAFTPDEYDYSLGALWPFDNEARQRVLAHSSRP